MASTWNISSILSLTTPTSLNLPLRTFANRRLQTSQTSQVSMTTLFEISEIPIHIISSVVAVGLAAELNFILRWIETNFYSEQFVEFYYNQFDADRKQLAPLYVSLLYWDLLHLLTVCQRENSMLTFESASVAGAAGIVEKLSVSNTSLWWPVLLRQSSSYRASHSRKSNMPSRLLMHNPLEIMAESWSLLQAPFWWVAEPNSFYSEMSS